jgi:predicted nuclease of predicted toxin-antitoxin system
MRLLLDECLPKQLKRYFTGHETLTVPEAGLAGLKNGALLRRLSGNFDVFITIDSNLRFQQNLAAFNVAVIVLRAHSNDMADLLPLVPDVLTLLASAKLGMAVEVGAPNSR